MKIFSRNKTDSSTELFVQRMNQMKMIKLLNLSHVDGDQEQETRLMLTRNLLSLMTSVNGVGL